MLRDGAATSLAAAFWLAASASAAAQSLEAQGEPSPSPVQAVANEAVIYWDDAKAMFFAPFHWNAAQVRTAVGAGALIGGVMVLDEKMAENVQNRASSATAKFSDIVTPLGGWVAYAFPAAMIGSGLVFHEKPVTTIGREGLEAVFLSDMITTVLKPVFGRDRPADSNNETSFQPFSGNQGFPSGHATVAFALASVISARTDGWVVPTVSYSIATAVAYCRVNDKRHFPADVLAGGLIGTAVGQFIVHRHQKMEKGAERAPVEVSLFPIRSGLGVSARF